jgi:hypothetical protein
MSLLLNLARILRSADSAVGYDFLCMLGASIVYTGLLLLIDSSRHALGSRKSIPTLPTAVPADPTEDPDVRLERQRIERGHHEDHAPLLGEVAAAADAITVRGLRKVFRKMASGEPKVAVRNLNLGIPQGEWSGRREVCGRGQWCTHTDDEMSHTSCTALALIYCSFGFLGINGAGKTTTLSMVSR